MYTALTTVLFVFPPSLPVTPTNMNYCIAAFGIMFLIAGVTWLFVRKQYQGPVVELHGPSGESIRGFSPVEESKPSEQMEEFANACKRE